MRKKGSELVIHIISFGAISFLFYFIIFPHLQFTAGEFENFTTGSLKTSLCRLLPSVLILVNHNLFVSFVLLVSCFLCDHISLCSGTETLQADWKG